MEPLVQVEHLRKQFNGTVAVADVSFIRLALVLPARLMIQVPLSTYGAVA